MNKESYMSLIKCPECNKEISDQAAFCPFCGYPIKGQDKAKEKVESFIVAYRSGPGSIVASIIIVYFLFAMFLFGAIMFFVFSQRENALLVLGILMSIFDFIFLITGIVYTGYFINNKKNMDKNCIEYDAEKDKLVLCTIYREIIEIDVEDYVELRDNFFTDNMLLFTYKTKQGQLRKVKLGYCGNRDSIRDNIAKIRK